LCDELGQDSIEFPACIVLSIAYTPTKEGIGYGNAEENTHYQLP
jgi:hypothetical protein